MLTLLFMIFMVGIVLKLFIFGLRAAWGITRLILTIVFLPVTLIGLVFGGFMFLAIPLLIIAGIVSLVLS